MTNKRASQGHVAAVGAFVAALRFINTALSNRPSTQRTFFESTQSMNAQKVVGLVSKRLLKHQTSIRRTSRCFSFGATRSKPITDFPYAEVLTDSESANRYGAGGFSPIHLGDEFKGGRYKILHKLCWGSDSTVWAARDQRFFFFGTRPHTEKEVAY